MELVLSDGTRCEGTSFGAARTAEGEVVFSTGLTGYVEALTDPSYRGQILVFTYPLQGNYGVPAGPFESGRIQVEGVVVSHHTEVPSHRESLRSLGQWLAEEGVPALQGVDTRTLTRRLREHGTMRGSLRSDAAGAVVRPPVDMASVAELVAPRETVVVGGGEPRILVIDTGAKESIVRALVRRGATVVRAPFFERWEEQLRRVDGVLLTNGPGDPRSLGALVERLRTRVLAAGIPTFGICLGHQLLALAAGGSTFKLPYGHRSHNQPVLCQVTRRAYITSQNHGYAVDGSSLPRDVRPWFTNLNDGTNEGIVAASAPFRSVQFHPEAAAGPKDTEFLFDDFLRLCGEHRPASRSRSEEALGGAA